MAQGSQDRGSPYLLYGRLALLSGAFLVGLYIGATWGVFALLCAALFAVLAAMAFARVH